MKPHKARFALSIEYLMFDEEVANNMNCAVAILEKESKMYAV